MIAERDWLDTSPLRTYDIYMEGQVEIDKLHDKIAELEEELNKRR